MAFEIVNGYIRKCKENQGGVKKIYLFPYVKYSRSQIILNGNVLESYPPTTIYEFSVENNPNVSQTQNEDAGGKYFSISISLELSKEFENKFTKIINKDYNIIIEDRNGKLRFLGNRNGLECVNITHSTGGSKNSFNGLRLTFEGREEDEAWYIENLQDAGFNFEIILASTSILASTNLISSIY